MIGCSIVDCVMLLLFSDLLQLLRDPYNLSMRDWVAFSRIVKQNIVTDSLLSQPVFLQLCERPYHSGRHGKADHHALLLEIRMVMFLDVMSRRKLNLALRQGRRSEGKDPCSRSSSSTFYGCSTFSIVLLTLGKAVTYVN